jgi:hypothetical protein
MNYELVPGIYRNCGAKVHFTADINREYFGLIFNIIWLKNPHTLSLPAR